MGESAGWRDYGVNVMNDLMAKHEFNSDGFCKECGVSERNTDDPFCDGSDDPDDWLEKENPAYSLNVSLYLLDVQFKAMLQIEDRRKGILFDVISYVSIRFTD